MESTLINYDDFAKVDIRIGRVKSVLPFEWARNPSYKVEIEFGLLGTKWSSAQVTDTRGKSSSADVSCAS